MSSMSGVGGGKIQDAGKSFGSGDGGFDMSQYYQQAGQLNDPTAMSDKSDDSDII